MFGLGFLEICVIAIVTLIFVGPQKLPEIMKRCGKLFIYLKRTSYDIQSSIQHSLDDIESTDEKEPLIKAPSNSINSKELEIPSNAKIEELAETSSNNISATKKE